MQPGTRKDFRDTADRPARVVWAVAEHEGRRSICPCAWKMTTSLDPWMMAVSVAPSRYTHELIEASGTFVLAWPGEDLAAATYACGTQSGRHIDKFAECGLTPLPATHVEAPLVKECIANLECRLDGQLVTGDHTVFAGEILACWIHDAPARTLCMVGDEPGWDVLLEKGMYRFGVVKA